MSMRSPNKSWVGWENHILNIVVISLIIAPLAYLLRVWEIPLFWELGLFAIILAFCLDRIPKRNRWLIVIILTLPIVAIVYAKAGISQYLLVDAGIFFLTLELIEYYKEKQRVQ